MAFPICPGCQRKVSIPEEFLGQKVMCPYCESPFVASPERVVSAPPEKAAKQLRKPPSRTMKKAAAWLFFSTFANLLVLGVFVVYSLNIPDQERRIGDQATRYIMMVIFGLLLGLPTVFEMAGAFFASASRQKGMVITAAVMAFILCLVLLALTLLLIHTLMQLIDRGAKPDILTYLILGIFVTGILVNLGAGITTLVAVNRWKKGRNLAAETTTPSESNPDEEP